MDAPEDLSNTAVPKYYAEFREMVMAGKIPVNREIEMEMNRIDALIANPRFYCSNDAVEGFIRFCEDEMVLTNGEELRLLFTFKLWAEQLFCWYEYEKQNRYVEDEEGHGGKFIEVRVPVRLVKKQYLIVARGAAKSLYETLVQAFFLNVDPETTHQITTSPTMKQAEEVMSPFRTAITRPRGPLYKFLTAGSLQNTTGNRLKRQKLAATKKGIENFLTNSYLEIRPMSIDKLQGLRPKCSTVDEWLSGDVREDVIGAIEQGASKLDDYVILAVSSEGTVRNGSGDTVKIELQTILRGEYYAPHVSIWHYKLDSVEEVANPAMWPKAQPNIGLTVSWETYRKDVERAEKAPSTANDILAKRFGIPREGISYFFAYEDTIPHEPRREFRKMRCSLGADLSQGDDFCAFTFLFPMRGEKFGVKTRSYITSKTMMGLSSARRAKYEEFMREGTLIIMDGITLDMDLVWADLSEHIDHMEYDICSMGYDPYNSKEFLANYEAEYGPFAIEKVIQGARTESVPLGELKNLAEARLLIFDEILMMFTMGNAVTEEDNNGNRKLYKKRQDEKVDNVAALMDAYVAWKVNKEAFE